MLLISEYLVTIVFDGVSAPEVVKLSTTLLILQDVAVRKRPAKSKKLGAITMLKIKDFFNLDAAAGIKVASNIKVSASY